MGERRTSLSDVLTLDQYRDLLTTAIQIEDREESLTITFLLLMLGRAGLRVGEAIHMTEDWYHADRSVIIVPEHLDCGCGLCRHYASSLADNNEDMFFEEAIDKYWRPKGGQRHVPIGSERTQEIIELYFDEVPYTRISYSTVSRRLKKVAELTDGVDSSSVYPHMLRATAATHYAWAGVRPPALDVIFGWLDEKTKEHYVEKTAFRASKELARVRDTSPKDEFELRENPPTYTELRPKSNSELITVNTWSPESRVNVHPRYRDDEEWLQEKITEYNEDNEEIPAAVDPVTAGIYGTASTIETTHRRLEREWNDLTDEDAEWPTPREAAQPTAEMLGSLVLMGILFASTGFSLDPIAGEVTLPSATSTAGLGSGLVGGIVRMLWIDHCERIEEIPFTKWLRRKIGL
jgi:hypothetical protein